MNRYQLRYGDQTLEFGLEDDRNIDVIEPPFIHGVISPGDMVTKAVSQSPVLNAHSNARTAAIAINDKTRPVPFNHILPPLINTLVENGIAREKIIFIAATGVHTPMSLQEIQSYIPEGLIPPENIYTHDCDDLSNLIDIGETLRYTRVVVNKQFYEADLKIVTGNIEPHHFMGFSGGAKTASIGLCGRETINQNHRMLLDPACRAGAYSTNPMRMDVEEIGKKIGIHYALNVILNSQKEITHALAGDPVEVMKKGIRIIRRHAQVPVEGKYDLVVASPGGKPKDINLYQAEKALTHAAMITRDGGVVILAAACYEGVGSEKFLEFLHGVDHPQQALKKFADLGFEIGPHKAYQIAKEAVRIHLILVSEIEPALVRKCMFTPAEDLPAALNMALNILPPNPRIAILPRATNTLPAEK